MSAEPIEVVGLDVDLSLEVPCHNNKEEWHQRRFGDQPAAWRVYAHCVSCDHEVGPHFWCDKCWNWIAGHRRDQVYDCYGCGRSRLLGEILYATAL